jgi:transglutaminase-like putative cysteine protease
MSTSQGIALGLMAWQVLLISQSYPWPSLMLVSLTLMGSTGIFIPRPICLPKIIQGLAWGILGVVIFSDAWHATLDPILSTFRVFSAHWMHAISLWLFGIQSISLWSWSSHDHLPRWLVPSALTTSFFAFDLPAYGVEVRLILLGSLAAAVPAFASWKASSYRKGTSRYEQVLGLGIIGLMSLCTWGLIDAWSLSLPEVQTWFVQTVGQRLPAHGSTRIYVNSGNLNAIRSEVLFDPNRTALRVFSESRPGYLASRRFDEYQNGVWILKGDRQRNVGERPSASQVLTPTLRRPDVISAPPLNANTFIIDGQEMPKQVYSYRVRNDPRRGPVYFSSLGLRAVQGHGDSLSVDNQQSIRGGIRVTSDYTIFTHPTQTLVRLDPEERRQLTQVPEAFQSVLERVSAEIPGDVRSFNTKVESIRRFFQNEFRYSTARFSTPNHDDPLAYFLTTRPAAHCEFFASATVLLLRAQGIPARYSTGYRVMELEEENGDFWIAKNKNAHAWAEAYDEARQRWVIVESTPGFLYDDGEILSLDPSRSTTNRSDLNSGEGNAAERLLEWLIRTTNGLGPAPIFVALLVVVGLLGIIIYVPSRQRRLPSYPLHPCHSKIRRQITRLDRQLSRRGIRRGRGETLHHFANRLATHSALTVKQQSEFQQVYTSLANRRYLPPG